MGFYHSLHREDFINLNYLFFEGKIEELKKLYNIEHKKDTDLKFYDEILYELKTMYKIKTKEYALIGITTYKLDSTFINSDLYEDEDIMYELIKNESFYTCGDRYIHLKIFDNKDFVKQILNLDEKNIKYILNNYPEKKFKYFKIVSVER